MDSEMLANRDRSSVLHPERSPERYNQPVQLDHVQGRTYDQPSVSPRTDCVASSPLGTVAQLRYNRIDLSPNSRPLLSQFRLSDHMPVSSLPRSLAGCSDLKKNVYNREPEKNGLRTHSMIRGLSVTSSSQMDTRYDPPAHQQSRAQSLLDLHKQFSPLETRTSMGSQLSLKSFNNQSPDMNTPQLLNRSYNQGMTVSSENQIDRSPPYNVFSYQSRNLNIPVSSDVNDRSRTVIVKSTLCYNTSTQTEILYTDSLTDPSVGAPRMRLEDLQDIEVLPKKIERFGRICEEKSVQTSQYRDVSNSSFNLKSEGNVYKHNIKDREVFQHSHNIMQYGVSSCGSGRGQTDMNSYNSDRKHSGNYNRQVSYEYNRPLESSQKNQTRYASHEILNEDILQRQSKENSFLNTAPVLYNQTDEFCLSKHGMISKLHPATVFSHDTPTNGNRVLSEATRCAKSGTDSNNNECSHCKTPNELYHFSDYSSTTSSLDSRHIPTVCPRGTHLGSSADSLGYPCYPPEAVISKSRSSSLTMYDHFEGMPESAYFTSPMTTDPGMKVHNLSLTSGVGSEVSSVYSNPRSPPLDSPHVTPFTQNQQSFSHATDNTNISPPDSSTFQWKKIVILNPEHIKTSRRYSDSVFIDEDDVEPKYLLYKDFRQKTFPVEIPSNLNKLPAQAFLSEDKNPVRLNTDDPFKSRDREVSDQSVPPSPKSRAHRISESLSLGQIQEETEVLNAGMDTSPGLTSRSENISSTSDRSPRSGVEKYENQLWQNETWLRSLNISGGNLKQRRSEPFVEASGNIRRYSLDSAKLQRNRYQGGDNSQSLSAFRNYKRTENSTPTYSVTSSKDLVILRRESDLQVTKQQLQKLQATYKQDLRSTNNDLRDLQCGRRHMPVKCYEGESSSSSSTLQDISSLDNSLASIRNPSVSETVAELIVKVNENLTKSAERMVRIRRTSSSSSRNSLDFIDTTRPERGRRETDWTRIRSLGSLRSSPERDHLLNWSSFASDYLNDDTGMLTSSTPRSSFALSRDKENMLEASSLNASMDSGLVVSPIYQNFPTKRRPPPPPRPAASSDTEPPPLPPRMNREKQPCLSGTQAAQAPDITQYDVSGKEKHRIEVIPLGKPQDEDVRVDTSKMNFKDLMMQWKSNSPRETISPSDLRRHEQKPVEKYPPTGKVMSSVPTTFERTKTSSSLSSTYRYDPGYNLDATSPVFSSTSSSSTLQSSPSKSAFSTSPSSSFGGISESSSSSLQHRPLGFQPSLNKTSYALYPGVNNTSSSSIDAPATTTAAYTDDGSNTPTSNSGIRVTLVNQSRVNTGQTPPFGKISLLTFSRSRSSSDLLSDQLAGNVHSPTAASAPVKLHRLLRDRSSSVHDILSDKPSQSRAQYRYHFRPPQNDGDFTVSTSQSSKEAHALTLRSPQGEGIKSTPIANGRLSNSSLALSNGYGLTDDNLGFADESYIGHKNKSSRSVGTYKRSFSAVGVQSTSSSQGNPPTDSDSTPLRDFNLGQQSWNSESLLTNTGNGVKTLPEMGSQFGKAQKDGVQSNQGYNNGVSNATPVRPPRPNARARQNAKQSSVTSTASSAISSSSLSQKTKLAWVSLSALDSPATPASFNVEQGNGNRQEKLHRSAAHTPSSPPYDHNYQHQWAIQQESYSSGTPTASGQDHWSNSSGTFVASGQDLWSVQQGSNYSGTLAASGQVNDKSPVSSLHHSPYSPQHRQLALNNSLNSSLSRASLDNGHPQSTFTHNSAASPLSPCSPSEHIPVNSPTKDHQRKNLLPASGSTTSPTSLENSPKSLHENPTVPAYYQPDHKMNTPREPSHKSASTPTLNHLRQPSQEEIECDEKALELAEELDDNDQKLLEVLKQDQAKKRMLYMDGLFSDLTADQEKAGFKQKSRSSMKNRTLDRVVGQSYDSSGGFKSHSLPRDYQQTTGSKATLPTELLYGASTCSSDTTSLGVPENMTVIKHKEELVEKLHKKILVLKDEKLSLQREIADNILLGQQVCQVADSRCQSQNEKEKFMTFIDDLEKIVRLLLNLSGQLARAENAVQALGPGTDAKLKKLTWDKREKLHAKHEEAKMLKEAVDRRSEQLLCMLQERLSTQELADYKHFINMKSRLTIQMQEVDDYLALAEQQVVALRKSLSTSDGSFSEKYREA